MTERRLQLDQHGRSLIVMLIELNSIYTFFSTFENALSDQEKSYKDIQVFVN